MRDNIHAVDVVSAFHEVHRAPKSAAVYNLGGGRQSDVSMLEAIALCETIAGRTLNYELSDEARIGDHRWWISDLDAFRHDYPDWSLTYGVPEVLREIHDLNAERWLAQAVPQVAPRGAEPK